MTSLQKTFLVTGASSGIGRTLALLLARRGHRVFAAARRRPLLDELAASSNGRIVPVTLDVRDQASIDAAVATVLDQSPEGIDVLVNVAGYAMFSPVETSPIDAVRGQFETNVIGLLAVTQAVLPHMREKRRGRIVNISSILGKVTFPGVGVYGATKYAVEAISDALRMEVAGFGIDVVMIEPAFVNTDIVEASAAATTPGAEVVPDYREWDAALVGFLQKQVDGAIAPEKVAAAIARAATVQRPRARYLVPKSVGGLIGTLNALPTRAADAGKRQQVGITKKRS